MKRILFPFETNQHICKEAYVYAVKFARNLGAELIMLNVFNVDVEDCPTSQDYKKIVRENYFKAYQEIIRFNKHYLGNYVKPESELRIKVDYRFLHGNLVNELTQIISNEEIDLIVLPEAYKEELYKWIVEVIWQHLSKHNTLSLLLIPSECRYQPIKSTALVADMKKLDHLGLYLNDVLKYAKVFDANVHFLNISQDRKAKMPEGKSELEKLIHLIEGSQKHVFHNLTGHDLISSIEEYSRVNNVQMVFVIKHHHYFINSLFHKDISDKICLRSNIPVLVMKEKAN